jgi:mono/diheme cytochrome c family protein
MQTTPTTLGRRLVLALPLALLLLGGSVGAQDIDTGEGETVYQTQCAACHQATGAGIPAAFPPLAGHVYELVGAEGGRTYPILVTLYGLMGPITVHGAAFNGLMPPMAHLSDEQIADVLNYIMVAWGDIEELDTEFEPYTPEEVAEQRGLDLDAAGVHAVRATLDLE